ncbi:MAG: hypothetical protein WC741_01355 [Patescibacteria group bacterium]|jgi:hypothetical protein
MFKRNIFKILAVAFFLLSAATLYNSNKLTSKKIVNNKQVVKKIISPTEIPLIILSPTEILPTQTIIPTLIIKGSDNPAPSYVISTPPQQDIINLEINGPDGNNKFSLTYKDGANPCSILNDAKNDGKIRSVTILHYGAPLNSDYVKEINGFSDNWNFSIDGSGKPSGCSNYILNKNSTVTWKYN